MDPSITDDHEMKLSTAWPVFWLVSIYKLFKPGVGKA